MTDNTALEVTMLQRTPLYGRHTSLNARMAPFGGWEMPIQYEGILAEHRYCRTEAALFDICHMGEILCRGDVEKGWIDSLFTFPVSPIPVGRARYGFLLNERGGIIDDLIVFKTGRSEAFVVTNAARTAVDFATIRERLSGGEVIDLSPQTAKLDLQGPRSREVLTRHLDPVLGDLPYFRFVKTSILGVEGIVSRTGYTGELGYEIFLPVERVGDLWDLLLSDDRVRPAGLGARDILRLEMGYSLYGNDIDEEITPLEAGLLPFVDLSSSFVGKGTLLAMKERGAPRGKISFRIDGRRTPRHGYRVLVEGMDRGVVTSGCFSPTLSCGIGLAMVDTPLPGEGDRIVVTDGTITMEGSVCQLPFHRGGSLRG
ncbi:MAG: glycine cleavage system aminomethyltransferase GcvT [Desulfuromonadia bacterium]